MPRDAGHYFILLKTYSRFINYWVIVVIAQQVGVNDPQTVSGSPYKYLTTLTYLVTILRFFTQYPTESFGYHRKEE